MNTDIRLSVDFYSNLKVKKLEMRLGDSGIVSLQKLWMWCAKERPSGVLTKCSKTDIGIIAEWKGGDFDKFADVLIELEFVDVDPESGTLSIHDWAENNPYAASAESRSDEGRLNRLKRENPGAAQRYVAEGRRGISKEEYYASKQGLKVILSDTQGDLKAPLEGNLQGDLQGSVYSSTSTSTNTKDYYYDAREKGGAGGKETQPPAEEAAASLSTPSGSKSQPQEPQPEPEELVLSAAPAKPPAPSKPQPVPAQAIADLWNRMMPERGFARVTRVTNQRAAHIRARQREFKTRGAETLDFWRKVFVVTYRSDLLNGTRGRTGKDGRRWQADFDFCIESEEKLTRLIEGKYDNDDSGGYEWVDYQSPPQRLDKAG